MNFSRPIVTGRPLL